VKPVAQQAIIVGAMKAQVREPVADLVRCGTGDLDASSRSQSALCGTMEECQTPYDVA
jgi:hypothetical protein